MRIPGGRAILPAALALLAALPAGAYVRTRVPLGEACLYWDQRQLPFSMQVDGSSALGFEEARAVVVRSFLAWQDVECSDLEFLEGPEVTARVAGYEAEDPETNTNVILFRQELCEDVVPDGEPCWSEGGCGNLYDCWEFGPGTIALTTTTFEEDSGRIVDADIEFNEANYLFTSVDEPPCDPDQVRSSCVATDLQNTATHEIGHLLGLDHTPVENATMYRSAPLGQTSKRSLARDDVEGLCAIYPEGGVATQCDGSSVHDGNGCGCAATGPEGLGLVGLGGLALRAFRRAHR